jgi:hypothetical protein
MTSIKTFIEFDLQKCLETTSYLQYSLAGRISPERRTSDAIEKNCNDSDS